MSKIKNYFIYTVCTLFTLFSMYLLIDSFTNPDLDISDSLLLKERLSKVNSILLFGGLGFVYFVLKNNKQTFSGNYSPKINLTLIFCCLIFITNSIFIIVYPEGFKGSKLIKLIIGYVGLIFFGIGLIASIINLFRKQ